MERTKGGDRVKGHGRKWKRRRGGTVWKRSEREREKGDRAKGYRRKCKGE